MKFKTGLTIAGTLAVMLVAPYCMGSTAAEPAQEVVTVAAQAQESSWTGKIEQRELNGEMLYVLNVGGQSYLVTPQDKAQEFNGKTVTVRGKLEGSTVTISEIFEE